MSHRDRRNKSQKKDPKRVIRRHPIESIEAALGFWEDFFFLGRMHLIGQRNGAFDFDENTGALAYSDNFRTALLESRQSGEMDMQMFGSQFGRVEGASKETKKRGTALDALALAVFNWSKSSRRVFHLPADLVFLLQHTSLHNLTWGEIAWPFESFAVTLEEPIVAMGNELDCFVVHPLHSSMQNHETKGGSLITGLGPAAREAEKLSTQDRRWFRYAQSRREWREIARRAQQKILETGFLNGIQLTTGPKDVKIVNTARWMEKGWEGVNTGPMSEAEANGADLVYRVVAGFCQYLASLPPKSPHVQRNDRIERTLTMDRRAITAEADVATVASYYRLTQQERELMAEVARARKEGRTNIEIGAHFRRGHWRRPWGTAHLAESKQTKWVRPTLVMEGRLLPDALPGGTLQIMEVPNQEEE